MSCATPAASRLLSPSEDIQSAHFAEIAQRLLEVNIPVAVIPALTRLPLANATTSYFFGRDILMLQVRSNVQRLPWRIVKRTFDLGASALLLSAVPPFFLVLADRHQAQPAPARYFIARLVSAAVAFLSIASSSGP